jgi:8-oxo-(d)GTP phosphatase
MLVLLLRHGHAGTKRHWRGDESMRPLDPSGLADADELPHVLAPYEPARILSSPFLRCMQSVTPLAESLGVRIEHSASLVPDAGMAATQLACTVTVDGPGSVVLCTHGEVIRDIQALLEREGDAPEFFGPEPCREKGSVWVLDRTEGRFTKACYLPPPTASEDRAHRSWCVDGRRT